MGREREKHKEEEDLRGSLGLGEGLEGVPVLAGRGRRREGKGVSAEHGEAGQPRRTLRQAAAAAALSGEGGSLPAVGVGAYGLFVPGTAPALWPSFHRPNFSLATYNSRPYLSSAFGF